MVTFEFLKQADDMLFYAYYPNGKGEAGEVSISLDGENWKLVKESKDDVFGGCAEHALSKVYDMLMNGEIPKNGISAWY